MTYCLTIKIKDGLIALADCRVTSGTEVTTARKVLVLTAGAGKFFIMSSGLRSVRDKVVAYVEREIAQNPNQNNMLVIINLFTRCMRQAEREDRVRLEQSGLLYNAHAIVGGMMPGDKEPTAYMVYPEANWVEVDHRTPFLAIGAIAGDDAALCP